MKKPHTTVWVNAQTERALEPIKNTKRYYYKKALLEALTIILIPKALITFHMVRHYIRVFEEQSSDYLGKGRTVTLDGTPGSGKTFVGSNMAYNLALRRWQELKFDYFTNRAMLDTYVRDGDTDKIIAFEALEAAYKFYVEQEADFIPCLVSTIPLTEYGTNRRSYELTQDIFYQTKRLPEYTVLFNDESGLNFGGDTSKDAEHSVKEFWRFIRQFADAMAINTEQDGGFNGIYIRRSTDYVNHLYGQEWIMAPKRLLKRFNKKKIKYFKQLNSGVDDEYLAEELYFQNLYIRSIGFREITYRLVNREGAALGDYDRYILPAIGSVHYNDRAYRLLYQAIKFDIDLNGFESELVD